MAVSRLIVVDGDPLANINSWNINSWNIKAAEQKNDLKGLNREIEIPSP